MEENEKCTCLEDNKLSQAFCRKHGNNSLQKESPMTEPNMEWEEIIKADSYRALCESDANQGSDDYGDWHFDGEKIERVLDSILDKAIPQAYEKGKAEERRRIAEEAEKLRKEEKNLPTVETSEDLWDVCKNNRNIGGNEVIEKVLSLIHGK